MLTRRRRDRGGKIQKESKQLLIDMPLDILFEIFYFLDPVDLLRLARTSKALRKFLLDRRKASALWKNVLGSVEDFPPCPDHMSPPAYARLAFVPVCHGCFRPCETIEWELRMRCCSDCFPKMTVIRPCAESDSHVGIQDLPRAHSHYRLSNADDSKEIIVRETFHGPSFSRLDWKVLRSRKRPQTVSKEEFAAQQKAYWQSIRTFALLCKNWEYTKLSEKAAQLSVVKKQRIRDIEEKLEELGWDEQIWSFPSFWKLPEVSKAEPLTPAEWFKICPTLIRWVQKIREYIIGKTCKSTFDSIALGIKLHLRDDASLRVHPREVDIATLPATRLILESDILEDNVDLDTVDDYLRIKCFHVLPPAIRKWSSDAVDELEHLARKGLDLPPCSKPSCLPWVIFRCKRCSRSTKRRSRFTFDEALSHDHLYKDKHSGYDRRRSDESPYDKVLTIYDKCPRSIKVLQVDGTVSRRVENMIKKMGQDPRSATYDVLRRSTVEVVCGLCDPGTRMGFRCALDHCLNAHVKDKKTKMWTRAPARK